MKISLCMITWNEEELLPAAVMSADGLADQVVVVDTGSTDDTVGVAQRLGTKVLTGADRYHKGDARNMALDAATGDWCVILDADEKIADPEGLRAFLETTDAQAIYIKLAYVDGGGNYTLSYSQMRCWRHGAYRYKYRAHEIPLPTSGWGKQVYTEFIWEHRPSVDRVWKSDYTLKRLLLDVDENPHIPRPIYYLGRQYMYRREWNEAVKWLEKFVGTSAAYDKADAWLCLSKCYSALKHQRQEISALYQMCAEDPLRREGWCGLANLYHQRGDDAIALGLLKCALELPMPPKTYVNHYWHGAAIYDLTARVLWKLQRYEEGHIQAEKAVELSPDDARLRKNLQFFIDILEAKEADYYDHVYGETDSVNKSLTIEVAKRINGESVLDLGCGVGFLASLTEGKYLGIDFSSVALGKAHKLHARTDAEFLLADIYTLPLETTFGTVVLQEVLEHLDNPSSIIEKACSLANRRIIVTVPQNMPDPAHVKPHWTKQDIRQLLGDEVRIEPHDRYWIAVKDVQCRYS